jgi:histidine triad (HIT) family protein
MAKTGRSGTGGAGSCLFCEIVRGERPAHRVLEDEHCIAFLDHRPLLPGHCLLVPRQHVDTLLDLPDLLLAPLFSNVRLLARALEAGLGAAGSFTAINTKVSQSVPHLHIHVVPRFPKDGLFSVKLLWKRSPYESEADKDLVQARIRKALAAGGAGA